MLSPPGAISRLLHESRRPKRDFFVVIVTLESELCMRVFFMGSAGLRFSLFLVQNLEEDAPFSFWCLDFSLVF